MGVDRDSLRYVVERDGATVRANAYNGTECAGWATIKDPDSEDLGEFRLRLPHVTHVFVQDGYEGNGIGQRVLETAIGAYPQGTEFTVVASNKEFVNRFRALHPEIVLNDLF